MVFIEIASRGMTCVSGRVLPPVAISLITTFTNPFIGELANESMVCQNFTWAGQNFGIACKYGFINVFPSIADDRDCRIDKVEERVAIKLT